MSVHLAKTSMMQLTMCSVFSYYLSYTISLVAIYSISETILFEVCFGYNDQGM